MLTVDLDRLDVRAGQRVLDLGSGNGRHAAAAFRRGVTVVAVDLLHRDLVDFRKTAAAMTAAGEAPEDGAAGAVRGDALDLPFPDGAFDRVVASEVLEHVWADERALRELARVLRPGGRLAATVPSRGPERVCWALDDEYHAKPGGHLRIYRRRELEAKLAAAGLAPRGHHRAHALHVPYWWLRCAVGVDRDTWTVRRYHALLVWQITRQPGWLARVERLLDPVLGKSLVVYTERVAA